MEEAPALVKVPFRGSIANDFRNVSPNYCVTYQGIRYMLPKDKVHVKEVVRIEEDDGELTFYRAADNMVVHVTKKAEAPGLDIPFKEETRDEAVSLEILKRMYGDNETAMEYIARIGTTVKRYRNTHYRWVIKLSRVYTDDQMEEAIEHCVKADNCTAYELAAYLIYKTGEATSRVKMKSSLFYQCRHRAKEIGGE